MEFQITSEGDNVVNMTGEKMESATTSTTTEPGDSPEPALCLDLDVALPVDSLIAVDTKGSGDAPLPFLVCPPTLTVKDVQDMILPDPSIVHFLPALSIDEQSNEFDSSLTNDMFHPEFLAKLKGQKLKEEDQENYEDKNMRLTAKDILDIQELSKNVHQEDDEVKFDLRKVEALFRCETCQEMPISSATVHTCELGHQVCGSCYTNGARTCVVCKGNNAPLENVLRRLRDNYPAMFHEAPPPASTDSVTRFHSFKPIECPEDGCSWQSSARSLPTHFKTEHKHIPSFSLPLFKTCSVLVPEAYVDNVNGNVIAVVTLKITEDDVRSLWTDTMTCWVQCGAVDMGEARALAIWVSCAYEEMHMPPVSYNVRVPSPDGYSSFGGQMVSILDYAGPRTVLDDGKCLLLFPRTLKHSGAVDQHSLVVELIFYLR